MKKNLLLFFLLGTVGNVFSQIVPQPGYPCPVDINSNQGGGNCKACTSSTLGQLPTVPGSDFSQGTGLVVLDFGPNAILTCVPRLLRVVDKDGFTREVRCGLGNIKQTGNSNVIVEYCLFGDNDFNFFNQPELVAVLSYECGTNPPVIIACNSQGQQIPVPGEEIPLPVNFKSFNANRQNSNVVITWTTASEENSKGFNVQKNVGGEWKTIAFVFSQANGGNSSSDLSYGFKDLNTEKGITQYRIQQVDLDGKARYSDIRAIRGDGATAKIIVYPNPSVDGKLNVVFEDNSAARDVQVNDMQGRIVKSYRGITSNILVIERLTSGFYTIKVTNRNTAASSVEKVVVK